MTFTPLQKRNILFLLVYLDYGKTQQQIASFFNVSQPTVALGIKEAHYLQTIQQHQKEINALRDELTQRMGLPPSAIPKSLLR